MPSNHGWNTDELRAAVRAYLEMLKHHRAGDAYVKRDYYRELAKRYSRTAKAFEYRAQNISRVLQLQGREWLPGLVPAKNVGSKVAAQIEGLLAVEEGLEPIEEAAFELRVQKERQKRHKSPPPGTKSPRSKTSTSVSFVRDAAVKAWVLQQAKGRCEACESQAPFLTVDELPFLELHHVRALVDGGSDTVTNAVAVCPNCHRALHHAADREERTRVLLIRIVRLRPEQPHVTAR